MEPDFWAEIEFVDGQSRPNGWRPGFFILPIEDRGWMIWPITTPTKNPVAFQALDRNLYEKELFELLQPGVRFHLCEGFHLIARGRIVTPPPSG